jgi:hypothetical protein
MAEDANSGHTVFLEGGPLLALGHSFVGGVSGPSQVTRTPGVRAIGALGIGHQIDDTLDLRITGMFGSLSGNSEKAIYAFDPVIFAINTFGVGSGGSSTLTDDFDFQELDVEFGYRPGSETESFDVRLLAGVRALHFYDATHLALHHDGTGVDGTSGGDGTVDITNKFLGAGPMHFSFCALAS